MHDNFSLYKKDIDYIKSLNDNWDGNGAVKISINILNILIELLNLPLIVKNFNGKFLIC